MGTIVYEKITTTELAEATKSCRKSSLAEKNLNKHQGSTWTITSGFLLSKELPFNTLRELGDKKKVAEELKKIIHPALAEALGRPASEIKWTKDDDTRVICKYIGDFATIILADKVDEWLPGDDTCAPRCAILKECKSPLSNLKKISMYCENIGKVELEPEEVAEAMNLLVSTLNSVSEGISEDYKDDGASACQRLTVSLKAVGINC